MSIEMLDVLKEQAERLLMVLPGHFNGVPIDVVRKQIWDMYDYDVCNPDRSKRAQEIMRRMLYWISACSWVMSSMIPENGINPAELGIFKWHTWGPDRSFAVYCKNQHHYSLLPDTVTLKGEEFSKTSWNSYMDRCYYKSRNNVFVTDFE